MAALVFAGATVHPSMVDLFTPALLQSRRTESARLLGLTPLVLAPVGLYVIGGTGLGQRLPTPAYLLLAALVSLLAIVRGAQAVRRSERRATQDPLTGLANRRGLARAFDAPMATPGTVDGSPGKVYLLDLDDFNHVNDVFGHETGDRLLTAVGLRLQSAVGALGTVARSGGDEFVVLLTPTAPAPAELISGAFADPFTLETPLAHRSHVVQVSAGWTTLKQRSRLSQSLADADVALYASKAAGKGTVAGFHDALREDVLGRLSIAEDLRRLLTGDDESGHLELRFQPLVTVADGDVVGCEALVRWWHPHRGLLAPDAFLGLAEEYDLAAQIDAWVLREALDHVARWDAIGTSRMFVSVNLGRASMLDPDLDVVVRAALRDSGVDADRLHLEITEHDELPAAAGVEPLSRLARSGVKVSLDDFGIGYTSLDYVRRYPITTLKVDRSLVVSLQKDETSDLLRGVVLLAGCLGIEVLAEGIETPAQQSRLH
ncbi:putative bifunctional diguanylate cyclase/phosphodiesterase [Geodermatophilus sp. FMUSA9-8]|uniref:putative bifunctional diguanylate cyclase/phosphodiesterase n=1 Tax=Geodermatophilus sp. FMUSA9-8 TaxID=3120155 RepID=UPI00300ADA79